jgi:hypothetical protein
MPKYKPAFKIGDWVRVKAIASFGYGSFGSDERKMFHISITPEVVGQICGATYRNEGKRYPGDEYTMRGFTSEKSHLVWQVKTSITGKPLEATEKNIESLPVTGKLPFRSGNQPKWSEMDKESLRQEMKYWPRDSKGRWIKRDTAIKDTLKDTYGWHLPTF